MLDSTDVRDDFARGNATSRVDEHVERALRDLRKVSEEQDWVCTHIFVRQYEPLLASSGRADAVELLTELKDKLKDGRAQRQAEEQGLLLPATGRIIWCRPGGIPIHDED